MQMKTSLTSVLLFFSTISMAQYRVVDIQDGAAIAYATLHNEAGNTLGTTTERGELPASALQAKGKISITHIGYEPYSVDLSQQKDSLIGMLPITYALKEVSVGSNPNGYMKLKGFFRYYIDEGGKICYYKQGIANHYFKMKNGRPRVTKLNSPMYYAADIQLRKDGKLPNVSKLADCVFVEPEYKVEINHYPTEHLRPHCDTILVNKDKRYKKVKVHTGAENKTIELSSLWFENDSAETAKGLNLSLLGKLIGLKRFVVKNTKRNEIYRYNPNGAHSVCDLISISGHTDVIVKDKGDTKDRAMSIYGEFFVLDYEIIDKEDIATESKKLFDSHNVSRPNTVPRLAEGVEKAVKNMKSITDE